MVFEWTPIYGFLPTYYEDIDETFRCKDTCFHKLATELDDFDVDPTVGDEYNENFLLDLSLLWKLFIKTVYESDSDLNDLIIGSLEYYAPSYSWLYSTKEAKNVYALWCPNDKFTFYHDYESLDFLYLDYDPFVLVYLTF